MRIVYVYQGDWPKGASRVARQTKSLAEAGHDVVLLSRNYLGAPTFDRESWMEVRRLRHVRPAVLNKALNFPLFVSPVWITALWKLCREKRADCIVVSDLPLALTAVWVGRSLGIPVHYDMAEVYPVFIQSLWETTDMKLSDHLVRNKALAERLESRVLHQVDSVFVVSEESRERCLAKGVDEDRVFVVGNTTENPDAFAKDYAVPDDLTAWKDYDKVLFVGVLLADRGVAAAVDAIAAIVGERPKTALVVVGDGPDRERIEQRIRELDMESNVAMLGWKEPAQLPAYFRNCDLGLLPFQDSAHIRITLANKLFDYMSAGLPSLAIDVPPMRRILTETGAGCLYDPSANGALQKAIVDMLSRPEELREMGRRGMQAVRDKYRWSIDSATFVRRVESISREAA